MKEEEEKNGHTTIQLKSSVAKALRLREVHKRQSYNEIVEKMLKEIENLHKEAEK